MFCQFLTIYEIVHGKKLYPHERNDYCNEGVEIRYE